MQTTNYRNAFIAVATDSTTKEALIPVAKNNKKTIAQLQFDKLIEHPYQYTADDVLFAVYAERNNISKADMEAERAAFFSKGQPCFRASPLGKQYGWGVHSNEEGKIAIYPVESEEYKKLAADKELQQVKAMRKKRG